MDEIQNKTSRLMQRLERRMNRRPRLGLTPTFYARFGLADPWLNAPNDGDPSQVDDGYTFVSARPFYAMMRRLAQARWRRERRVSRFFERRSGVLTATRQRRFPGEIASPIAALMPASPSFMPPSSGAWRGLPDLGGMALPQAWIPKTEGAEPVEATPRRRRGSTARVSAVPWLSRDSAGARVVRGSRAETPTILERIVVVERDESERFAARPSREQEPGSTASLRGRAPGTREKFTVEPEQADRAPSRAAISRELPLGSDARRAAAPAADAEPSLRPAAPAQWAGLRLAHAAAAADPIQRAVEERAQRLPAAARRVLDEVIVSTEGLDADARVQEIRRILRRRSGPRLVREVLEELVPEVVDRPASVAAQRALPEPSRSRGLRPVLSSSPTMQTVAPMESPEPTAPGAKPRRAQSRPAVSAWARSVNAVGGSSPVGRRVEAARAAAAPASLSRSPVARAPLARSAGFRTPAGRVSLSQPVRTPSGFTAASAGFRTPDGSTVASPGFRTSSSETGPSRGFRTPGSETARSAGFRTPDAETLRSEAFRTPGSETERSAAVRTPGSETERSQAFRTSATETSRSEAFRTPGSETAQSEAFRTPAGTLRATPARQTVEDDEVVLPPLFEDDVRAPRAFRPPATARALARIDDGIEAAPAPQDEPSSRATSALWASERLANAGTPVARSGGTSILPRVTPSVTESAVVLSVSTPEEAEKLASEVRRRNPKAKVKVISGDSAWLSPRESAAPKGLTLAAMRDIAPSVGYTAGAVLRDGAARSTAAATDLRTAGPASYARSAPTTTVLVPGVVEGEARVVGRSATHRTGARPTDRSSAFRTPQSAHAGSQTWRTPEGRYVSAAAFRTPGGQTELSRGWRTPRGRRLSGAPIARQGGVEQLSGQLPALYRSAVAGPELAYAPVLPADERPLDWAGSRAVPTEISGYRGAFSSALPAPTPVFAPPAYRSPEAETIVGGSGPRAAQAAPSVRRARGARELGTTLGAVHQGYAIPGAPAWAERGTEEPRVRTAGDILRTLARAGDEEEVVRIIIDRGQEMKGAMNLPSPVTRVIEEIRSRATAAAATPVASPQATMLGSAASKRSGRSGKTGSTRSSARVISGWTGLAARGNAASTQGVGDDRIMKLVRKLKGLILLAENQKSEAQRQVRLAASDAPGVRAEGAGDMSPNEKSEQSDVDVEALAREVLEVVSRELELRQERRQEDPDVSIWW